MHGHMNVKFFGAKQAKETYQCRNTKEKLYKTKAAIWVQTRPKPSDF
jgi:hypothetical protein